MNLNGFRSFNLAVCLVCLIVTSLPAAGQRCWSLPEDDWIFEALMNLRNSGLVTQRQCGAFQGRGSRKELANYAAYVHDELLARVEEMEAEWRELDRMPITFNEAVRLSRPIGAKAQLFSTHGKDISALRSAIEVLRPELKSMGLDGDELMVGVSVAATRAAAIRYRVWWRSENRKLPFRDVPTGHWVYDALEEGRNRQLFFGYPGELFRGGQFATRDEMAGMINALYQEARNEVMALKDEINAIILWDPVGPTPPSLREIALSLARFNWTLKHRRELIQFAVRF